MKCTDSDLPHKMLEQLKTRPDNTVIIHQSKTYSQAEYDELLEKIGELTLTMYSKEGVKELFNQFHNHFDSYDDFSLYNLPKKLLTEWIEQNL